jgi:hypothetical protein
MTSRVTEIFFALPNVAFTFAGDGLAAFCEIAPQLSLSMEQVFVDSCARFARRMEILSWRNHVSTQNLTLVRFRFNLYGALE